MKFTYYKIIAVAGALEARWKNEKPLFPGHPQNNKTKEEMLSQVNKLITHLKKVGKTTKKTKRIRKSD